MATNEFTFESYSEAIAAYDEALDSEGTVSVAGMDMWPANILRAVDPIAYRVGFYAWADSEGIDTDELEDDEDLP